VSRPRRPVARADVQEFELRVVRHRVPCRAPATGDPPLAGPRLGCHPQGLRLEAVRRIAGHGVGAPDERSVVGVVRRDVPANAILGPAVSDHDVALHDPGGSRDRVRRPLIDGHDVPHRLTGVGVERDETSIERADEDLAFEDGDSPIDHIAAGEPAALPWNAGIVAPEALARSGVDRVGDAPRTGRVHHPIHDQRRSLDASSKLVVVPPDEPQLPDVLGRDLIEEAVPILVVVPPVRQPVSVRAGVLECLLGDRVGPLGSPVHQRACGNQERQEKGACEGTRDWHAGGSGPGP